MVCEVVDDDDGVGVIVCMNVFLCVEEVVCCVDESVVCVSGSVCLCC